MYRKILVVVRAEKADDAVVAHARSLAEHTGAQITLLRVVTVADDGGRGLGMRVQLEIGSSGRRRRIRAAQLLRQLERKLRAAGVSFETSLVISTRSEADAILLHAARNGHDLIAMAGDSRPWYRRWIALSPADRVLRSATVPTLFIGDDVKHRLPQEHAAPAPSRAMQFLGVVSLVQLANGSERDAIQASTDALFDEPSSARSAGAIGSRRDRVAVSRPAGARCAPASRAAGPVAAGDDARGTRGPATARRGPPVARVAAALDRPPASIQATERSGGRVSFFGSLTTLTRTLIGETWLLASALQIKRPRAAQQHSPRP